MGTPLLDKTEKISLKIQQHLCRDILEIRFCSSKGRLAPQAQPYVGAAGSSGGYLYTRARIAEQGPETQHFGKCQGEVSAQ